MSITIRNNTKRIKIDLGKTETREAISARLLSISNVAMSAYSRFNNTIRTPYDIVTELERVLDSLSMITDDANVATSAAVSELQARNV